MFVSVIIPFPLWLKKKKKKQTKNKVTVTELRNETQVVEAKLLRKSPQ